LHSKCFDYGKTEIYNILINALVLYLEAYGSVLDLHRRRTEISYSCADGYGNCSLSLSLFWCVPLCGLVDIYQHFRDACCLIRALRTEVAFTSETMAVNLNAIAVI
jgi:hypothetical protein